MKLDAERLKPTTNRLRRALGQLDGVARMLEAGRACDDVVIQLAAVSRAVDRAGATLIALALEERLVDGDTADSAGVEDVEEMFLLLEQGGPCGHGITRRARPGSVGPPRRPRRR